MFRTIICISIAQKGTKKPFVALTFSIFSVRATSEQHWKIVQSLDFSGIFWGSFWGDFRKIFEKIYGWRMGAFREYFLTSTSSSSLLPLHLYIILYKASTQQVVMRSKRGMITTQLTKKSKKLASIEFFVSLRQTEH